MKPIRVKKIKTASLGDDDLDRQDSEITAALSPGERIEACLKLSDFVGELRHAAKSESVTVQFDSKIPAVYIYLRGPRPLRSKKTKQVTPGIIVDYDANGRPVGIELLGKVDFEFLFGAFADQQAPELKQLELKRHILEEILSSPIAHP